MLHGDVMGNRYRLEAKLLVLMGIKDGLFIFQKYFLHNEQLGTSAGVRGGFGMQGSGGFGSAPAPAAAPPPPILPPCFPPPCGGPALNAEPSEEEASVGQGAIPGGPPPTDKLIGVNWQDHREPSSIVECQDFMCLCNELRGNSEKSFKFEHTH
uniref:Uncharacterized protein n=1 Tax=Acrobeloides nanus TaxID=290746 RepID=A0A914DFK0_9BILA